MDFPDSILWVGVVFTGVITLLMIGGVGYKLFIKKIDQGFWGGLTTLGLVYVFGSSTVFGIDLLSQHQHRASLENATYYYETAPNFFRDLVDFQDRVCVIENSIKSKRCLLLQRQDENERLLVVGNDKYSIVRGGNWPFHQVVEFPPIKLK